MMYKDRKDPLYRLSRNLESDNLDIRKQAIIMLGEVDDPGVPDLLNEFLACETDVETRGLAEKIISFFTSKTNLQNNVSDFPQKDYTKENSSGEKILIIDDDVDTLRLTGLMLQRQGYQIAVASNGCKGLEQVISEMPDLIVLDWMMPDMMGDELARKLRANELTVGIPILMVSAKSQLDDKVFAFESGVDDYLTKPTHPTELQAHIKALLVRKRLGII